MTIEGPGVKDEGVLVIAGFEGIDGPPPRAIANAMADQAWAIAMDLAEQVDTETT